MHAHTGRWQRTYSDGLEAQWGRGGPTTLDDGHGGPQQPVLYKGLAVPVRPACADRHLCEHGVGHFLRGKALGAALVEKSQQRRLRRCGVTMVGAGVTSSLGEW